MKTPPDIIVTGVGKSFGSHEVLNNISVTFPSKKVTAVLGPSGTGKSVLLKLITGLLKPDTGSIMIGSTDMASCSSRKASAVCKKIGLLFQSAALFDSLTLLENVAFPLQYGTNLGHKAIFERAKEELDKVSLNAYAQKLPGEVSIGMRKRTGIARAMISDPEILLFDEPNTGLDPMVGQEIYDLINTLRAQNSFTGIIVSHEIPEVFQCCDRIVMLYGGSVCFDGSKEDFSTCENPIVHQFASGSTSGPIQIST